MHDCSARRLWSSNQRAPAPPVVAFICAVLAMNSLAAAQAGSIRGRVLDPTGVPLAQARVSVLNAIGLAVGVTSSDNQGSFLLPGIDAGVYQLTADAPGFVAAALSLS